MDSNKYLLFLRPLNEVLMRMVNQQGLNADITKFKSNYHASMSFPNIAIDAFLNPVAIHAIIPKFPEVTNDVLTYYVHFNDIKYPFDKLNFIRSILLSTSKTKRN